MKFAMGSHAGADQSEAEALLAESRELLHAQRAKRPRPHLDDKVSTACLVTDVRPFSVTTIRAKHCAQQSMPFQA